MTLEIKRARQGNGPYLAQIPRKAKINKELLLCYI